jgi:nucleoid-associated protein YgaU
MSSILQVIRFVIGLSLVIAGGFLAAPFVAAVIHSAQTPQDGRFESAPDDRYGSGQQNRSAGVFTVPGLEPSQVGVSHAASYPNHQPQRLIPYVAGPAEKSTAEPAIAFKPMPQTPHTNQPPGLTAAYRSTVEVPPPPLLDATSVPARLSVAGQPLAGEPLRAPLDTLPEHYRVKDGDDLTGIATRLYGHPRGAAVLWQANADRLASPELLPIGMTLVVPPAWDVFGADLAAATQGQQIEPAATVVPVGAVMSSEPPGRVEAKPQLTPELTPWLGQPLSLQPAMPEAHSSASRGSLRVMSGESLGSIAQRVYGDGTMAAAIFAANRDRLRSPDLLVPGMELRLP